MLTTLRTTESKPVSYPDVPESLNAAAKALDTDFIWQRIESYVSRRWTLRGVVFIAEGEGHWQPPLSPVQITTAEIWHNGSWLETEIEKTPLGGLMFHGFGTYRLSGTAGGIEVPPDAMEAFKRLAEYSAQSKGKAGARSETIGAGSINLSHTRSPAWMAEAIKNSGAGDLLRSYRMA